ncbi:MAG TPA: fibronectin type III domain-containing protein [Thermoanaerobaculia bacterium]
MSRKLILAFVLLTAWTSLAATTGELFPLTNTRYGAAGASAILRTNGTTPFVFWSTIRDIRVTRVVSDQNRSGEVVFTEQGAYDAAWTGTHFLAVTTSAGQSHPRIVGRVVDAQGHPTGQPFTIVESARMPSIAAGHGAVLLVYETTENAVQATRALLLTPQGQPAAAPIVIAPGVNRYGVTATANGFTIAVSNSQSIIATTLDTQGRVVAQSSLARPGNLVDLTLASRGPRTLVVWTDVTGIEAAIVESNGAIGPAIIVDNVSPDPLVPLYPAAASVVWNGNGWTVAYQAVRESPRMRVAHLDSPAQTVVSREETAGVRNPSLAVIGGAVMATWTPTALAQLEPAWLGALPLGPNEAYPVTFGAAEQYLEATATADGGMLAVWREISDRRVTLRAGVRTHTGQWTEHLLLQNASATTNVLAESDGRNFVVFASSSVATTTEAIFLDDSGRPTGRRVTVPRRVQAVAWGGSHYALIDVNHDVRLLSADGTLSAPAPLGVGWVDYRIASHGNGFLVVGGRSTCQFLLCIPEDVRALRLDANGQRVGVELELAPANHYATGVVWTGVEYTVTWRGANTIGFSRVPHAVDGTPSSYSVPIDVDVIDVARTSAGVALLSDDEVRYFLSGGGQYKNAPIHNASNAGGRVELVQLYGDTQAFVATRVQHAAPHNGVPRLLIAIVDGPTVARPDAPQLVVRSVDDRFLVDWTRPAGVVNGYRIEYRVDDGPWIEYERWFSPTETDIAVRIPGFGTTFAFRVRAFSDSGAGAYSNVATPAGRKRRATR